ncbi:hypothetical protein ACOSQ2_017189 [Xanthoceras sorbifolium]
MLLLPQQILLQVVLIEVIKTIDEVLLVVEEAITTIIIEVKEEKVDGTITTCPLFKFATRLGTLPYNVTTDMTGSIPINNKLIILEVILEAVLEEIIMLRKSILMEER